LSSEGRSPGGYWPVFEEIGGLRLRAYQKEVARAVVESVTERLGLSLVVMFPRQSGKNELQAVIEANLLLGLNNRDAELVKVSPTWKPQSLNAMRRLERVLERGQHTRGRWQKEEGYIYRIGQARIFFLSGQPESNIVGATASTLLEVDEAQDVLVEKYDREIAPMAASTNATRVFWGTAWTADTLLGRELRLARKAQAEDGLRRVFVLGADEVSAEVPAYRLFVAEQVRRLGRQHPLVRTQYFSEEVDAESGLFTAERLALMQGSHSPLTGPRPGESYAVLVDIGGQAQASQMAAQPAWQQAQWVLPLDMEGQDLTAATIVEVDLGTLADPLLQAPTYRVVQRRTWQGLPHARLYGELKALAEHWRARHLVIDATGLGLGLASFLERALGERRVVRFLFTQKSKSELGWSFLSIVESGRFKDYADTDELPAQAALKVLFQLQAQHCQSELLPGPGRILRWSVPENHRDPASGRLLHDDLLVSAALCARLEKLAWGTAETMLVPGQDVLAGLGEVY
jgi:hypothetical protein